MGDVMLGSLVGKAILDRGRATAAAALLILFYGAVAIISYNALGDTMVDLLESMPPALAAIYGTNDGTPVGMAVGAVYSIIAPAVVLAYTIGGGTGAAVGEENRGSLELLLANPLSRTAVLRSKAVVVSIGTVAVAIATWMGVLIATVVVNDGIGDRDVFALSVMLVTFGFMMGSLAMAISGWTGKSSLGASIAAGIAAVSWLMTTVFSVNATFARIAEFTPWHLYDGNQPMTNGVHGGSFVIMVLLTGLFVWIAVVGVNRRDLKG